MKETYKRIVLTVISILLGVLCFANAQKHKRQIYREQVLPALGGKIPEEAFRTDRLALNRLNKDGITVIDGVLLEAREHDKNPDRFRSKPEVVKVRVPPQGRYRDRDNDKKSVDTTYVIRKPVGDEASAEHARFGGGGGKPGEYSAGHRRNPIPTKQPDADVARGFTDESGFAAAPNGHSPEHYRRTNIYYEPIVAPLVLAAARDDTAPTLFGNKPALAHFYQDSSATLDWTSLYRQPSPVLFLNIEDPDSRLLFDSHQVIFLDAFHGRIDYSSGPTDIDNENSKFSSVTASSYTPDLGGGISETTSFCCDGKKGTFADVETKCQVFHECSGWSKTSFLCPAGTAYSEHKKRCEWWNTVSCGSPYN